MNSPPTPPKPELQIGAWTQEWPTRKGKYLFYGNDQFSDKPRLFVCRVGLSANDCWMYMTEGRFLYPQEYSGWFAEVLLTAEDTPSV